MHTQPTQRNSDSEGFPINIGHYRNSLPYILNAVYLRKQQASHRSSSDKLTNRKLSLLSKPIWNLHTILKNINTQSKKTHKKHGKNIKRSPEGLRFLTLKTFKTCTKNTNVQARVYNNTNKNRFLDLLVNWSVSKPSVNCNLLVKFVRASEQNLDWPLANWMTNYTCLATMRMVLITSA